MAALSDFLKQNTQGPLNKIFLASYIRDIGTAENKWKAVLKVMVEMALWTGKMFAPFRAAFVGAATILGFRAMQNAVRELVRDTGSLAAALDRLRFGQSLARQLAPFVGGITQAKQRVAELITLSKRGPFTAEQLGGAAVSLERRTRGGFAGTAAVQEVGAAAAGTGNDIAEVTAAVGNFYETLRSGRPIADAAEQLRELGIISQATATHMAAMRESGASNQAIFNELRSALKQAGESAKGAEGDLAAVEVAHAKARQELAQAFGMPWTHDEIENTKNMTEAMQAITPAVGRVSAVFAILFNGFSTAKSSIAEFVAKNNVLRGSLEFVAKAIGVVMTVAVAMATVAMPLLLRSVVAMTAGMYAMGGAAAALAISLRVLAAATVIGLVITGIIAITGAIYNFVKTQNEERQALQQSADAHRKAVAAIYEHITAVKTLSDRHRVLQEALEASAAAQRELDEALSKGGKEKIREALQHVDETTKAFQAAQAIPGNLPEEQALTPQAQAFQQSLRATAPGQRQGAIVGRLQELAHQETEIRSNRDVAQKQVEAAAEQKRAAEEDQRVQQSGSIWQKAGHWFAKEMREAGKRGPELAGAGLPPETLALPPEERAKLEAAEKARQVPQVVTAAGTTGAEGIAAERKRLLEQLAPTEEERKLQEERLTQERQLAEHAALRRGDFREATRQHDLSDAVELLKQNRAAGFTGKELVDRTMAQARDQIAESIRQRPAVVDDLQRLGLGGEVGAGDPTLDVARRQLEVQQAMVQYLQQIAQPDYSDANTVGATFQ